jgi:aspartate kinase
MIVCKFGGTSVQDADAIARLGRIVATRVAERPLVVVSALAKVTDQLVKLAESVRAGDAGVVDVTLDGLLDRHDAVARALPGGDAALPALQEDVATLRERLHRARGRALTPAERDFLHGQGELWSSRLVAAALAAIGVPADWVDARSVIVTDDRFGRATPVTASIRDRAEVELAPLLAAGRVPVTQGFIGATAGGVPTTLGRGGSDFTAALLGAALDARLVEIWTDVSGLLTADPRLVPSARTQPFATYEEAAELATFGAKVLHPATQLPLAERGIPIAIRNAREPEHPGTIVGNDRRDVRRAGELVRSVSCKRGTIVINVRAPRMLGAFGFLRQLFEVFERHEVVVDVLASSEVSVTITIDDAARLDPLVRDLERLGHVTVERDRAIVAVVGQGIHGQPGLAARVFGVTPPANVELISMGIAAINLTFAVGDAEAAGVVQRLHREFFGEG